ncbi:MAG: hypothetical protein PWR27_1165 [Petroclostridium sp.]|jgi:hypothetical protein|nr:hypothetical protein [Petroclostridium sp.]
MAVHDAAMIRINIMAKAWSCHFKLKERDF